MYIAIAILLLAITLAIFKRYVASLISIACAIIMLSFIEEKRCRE